MFGQKGAMVASWCGAMATGINSGMARLGEGSWVLSIMDMAFIRASMPNGLGTGGGDARWGLECPLWRDALLGGS
jgi:hypothetical protein